MKEGEENDIAKKKAYLPISRSLEVWRTNRISSGDGLSASSNWLRRKEQ